MSSPEYTRWYNMHKRCGDPKADNWKWYGGKGIRVCPAWGDFSVFMRDMGYPPTPRHQLDRIDSDGDYSPENCRWVLPSENCQNQKLRANNTSGVKGVSYDKVRDRWVASATYRRKFLMLYKGVSFERACHVRRMWEESKATWDKPMLGDWWFSNSPDE